MTSTGIIRIARDYREAQVFIKQLEEEADTLKQQLIAEMAAQGADTMQADVLTVRWTPGTSSRLDAMALRSALPDVAARFTKTMEVRWFSVA